MKKTIERNKIRAIERNKKLKANSEKLKNFADLIISDYNKMNHIDFHIKYKELIDRIK